jgi:HK97 family phage major capsid protein
MAPRVAPRPRAAIQRSSSFEEFRRDGGYDSLEDRAFWNLVTAPQQLEGEFEPELALSHEEFRVLSKATSGGGFLVPTDLAAKVTAAARAASTVAGLAQEFLTADGQTFNVALDATLGAAAWLAESGGYAAVDDTITQQAMGAFKATTKILVSEELRTDEAVALDDFLAFQLGSRIGALQELSFSTGSGSGQPLGLVAAGNGITIVTAAVGSSLLYKAADLLAVFKALPAAYRPTASWLIAADDFASLAGTTDSAGAFAFPSLQFDPPSLFGRPVYISGYLPTPAVSSKSLVFADFRTAYGIRRVNGVSIQRQDELASDSGQIGFRAWSRVDGRVLVADAARILQHSAT